jgi:hypothetical protein
MRTKRLEILKRTLHSRPLGQIKEVYMSDTDLNTWGLIAVPVGLTICFGVALFVWLREEIRAPKE